MTCIRRNLDTQNCCNAWQKGIRTIDGQYPDDNREFKISGGAGILITPITAGILITNTTDPAALEAGSNIELTPNGGNLQIGVVDGPTFNDDTTINGDLNVNGNIYNQGASYESHMEQVYTTNDYIIMRENAVTGLAAGSYAGFQVKLYDGVNDGRLVMDNSGTARVGDVGSEQPLLTRDEAADLTDGQLLKWDAANLKAIGITNNFTQGIGNIGDDTHPVKIVNDVATPVTNSLAQIETIDLSSFTGTDFAVTGIGTKLAQCKLAILKAYDTRNTNHKIAITLPGQSGGYCMGTFCPTPHETIDQSTCYAGVITIQNTGANLIQMTVKAVNTTNSTWGIFPQFKAYEITFIF